MKVVIFRPSVASIYEMERLSDCFISMKLIDKTVCEDRIIYVFDEIK